MKKSLEKWLNERRRALATIEETLQKLTAEKNNLRKIVMSLEELIQALPADDTQIDEVPEKELRSGSDMYKLREILRRAGKPLHINELLDRLNSEPTKAKKQSLVGQLGVYVRGNNIFTRPIPNTFGLKEFEKSDYVGSKFLEISRNEKNEDIPL